VHDQVASDQVVVESSSLQQAHTAHDQPSLRRSSRETKRHDYAPLSAKGWNAVGAPMNEFITNINNVSLKAALRRDDSGKSLSSPHKEIRSLISDRKAIIPVRYEDIPSDYVGKAIPIHCFLKETFSPSGELINIKSRIVAEGNRQHQSTYEDTTPPL
jgi:hypothetical protein